MDLATGRGTPFFFLVPHAKIIYIMLHKKESPAQAVNEQNAAVLQYSGSQIRFERIGGRLMVNATQMAKPFGLTPKDWLRTQQAKDLLNAATVRQKCLTADLLEVRQGGTPEKQGTWMHEDIALLFAQWLSPDFYLACNDMLKTILTKRRLEFPSKHGVLPIVHDGWHFILTQILYEPWEAVHAAAHNGGGRSSRSTSGNSSGAILSLHSMLIC